MKQYAQTIGTWPVKLGRRSETGDKVQEGDEITPSGSFYVCTRNDQSICYLALGLSYPNAEDAERGLRDGHEGITVEAACVGDGTIYFVAFFIEDDIGEVIVFIYNKI